MSAVLITGMSGAGKSTIAEVLARRGLTSIDADNDPLLARSVDSDGNVVEDLSVPDFAWLARHSWEWNPARLPGNQDRLLALGAIPIDARRPLDQVVDAILSCTLASAAVSQASNPSNQHAR